MTSTFIVFLSKILLPRDKIVLSCGPLNDTLLENPKLLSLPFMVIVLNLGSQLCGATLSGEIAVRVQELVSLSVPSLLLSSV